MSRQAAAVSPVTPHEARGAATVRPFNVLHTIRGLRVDGVVMVVLRNVTHAKSPEFRHHVCAMLPGGPMEPAFRERGIEPLTVRHAGPGTTVRSIRRLARIIRDRKIDLVHANRTMDLGIAGMAAKLCGIPVVSSLHWLGRAEDHPEDADGGAWANAKRGLTVASNRLLATKIIAVSAAVRDSFASFPGFPLDRTEVVHPGLEMRIAEIDPARRASLRAELGLDGAHPVLLNIGRLAPVKGQMHLLAVIERVRQRLPGARLLIAGQGPLRPELERAIAAANLTSAVTLLGSRSDVDDLLAVSDALVLASESEAAPLPPMEAMRAAKPVIATNVGGVSEIVVDGVSGFVVPRGDAEALAAAVFRMFESPNTAITMGEAGRAIAEERFDVAHSMRKTERIYRSILGRASSPGGAP